MIDPLAAFELPRQRLSLQALVTVGALHVALLWLMLHSSTTVLATRQVVIQYFSPITQLREKPAPAPLAPPAPKTVTVAAVPPPVPRVEIPAPPIEQVPAPIVQRMDVVTPPRATVKVQDIKVQLDARPMPEIANSRIEPVLVPVPVVPTPEPVPIPEPSPAPAPPITPVPAVLPTAIATPPRVTAITPIETPAAAVGAIGGSGNSSPNVAQPAPAPISGGSGLNLNYNYKADSRGRQKTVSEMANEQLNGSGRRDRLAEGVSAAEKPDCINSGQALGLLAPIAIAYNVLKDKCK